jgi:UDP-N-acetylglucosamine acyltransferase
MGKVHTSAIVEDGAVLGADVEIGPFSYIGRNTVLRDGVRILAHAIVSGATEIGEGTVIHPMAVLGGGPQYRGDPGIGARLFIGAKNVIREHVTMNGGSIKGGGKTTVGSNGYFMAYSHVAHDCVIGDGVTFANGVALGGHVTIGDGVNIGGLAAIQQYARIGRFAFVGGITGVPDDVIPYGMVWGSRARLHGLNLIGLKRRGMARERIYAMRAGFNFLFHGAGHLFDRAREVQERWIHVPELCEIAAFVLADSKRPICTPFRGAPGRDQGD